MVALEDDFPGIADAIAAAVTTDRELGEAFLDYQEACERMNDPNAARDVRAEWAQVRAELIAEIRQKIMQMEDKE